MWWGDALYHKSGSLFDSSDCQTSTDDESEYKTKYTTIWKYIKEQDMLQDMFRTQKIALLEEGVPAGEARQAANRYILPTVRRNIRRGYNTN